MSKSKVRTCRGCGCTYYTPCIDALGVSCHWVERDLCSACVLGTVKVRDYGQTYLARGLGKTASCTMGALQAAEAVAFKALGMAPHKVEWSPDRWVFRVVRTKEVTK